MFVCVCMCVMSKAYTRAPIRIEKGLIRLPSCGAQSTVRRGFRWRFSIHRHREMIQYAADEGRYWISASVKFQLHARDRKNLFFIFFFFCRFSDNRSTTHTPFIPFIAHVRNPAVSRRSPDACPASNLRERYFQQYLHLNITNKIILHSNGSMKKIVCNTKNTHM